MCVTSASASLNNTIVGAWDIQHPTYGYRHVLAYQNSPKNLASGANCMLLHVPTAEYLKPTDLIDTSACPELLFDLREKTRLEFSRGFEPQSAENHVVEMGVYHVVLLNDMNSTALATALKQVPKEKQPIIPSNLLDFYADNFPNYRLVLACFDNKAVKKASAIMLHYAPLFPDKIFFPLLEGHDGTVPTIGKDVVLHQDIIYGRHESMNTDYEVLLDQSRFPKELRPFLPKYGGHQSLEDIVQPNGDDWFDLLQSAE